MCWLKSAVDLLIYNELRANTQVNKLRMLSKTSVLKNLSARILFALSNTTGWNGNGSLNKHLDVVVSLTTLLWNWINFNDRCEGHAEGLLWFPSYSRSLSCIHLLFFIVFTRAVEYMHVACNLRRSPMQGNFAHLPSSSATFSLVISLIWSLVGQLHLPFHQLFLTTSLKISPV